jgi:hypothetical protein
MAKVKVKWSYPRTEAQRHERVITVSVHVALHGYLTSRLDGGLASVSRRGPVAAEDTAFCALMRTKLCTEWWSEIVLYLSTPHNEDIWGSGGKMPCIFKLGTTLRWAVNLMLGSFQPQGEQPSVNWHHKLQDSFQGKVKFILHSCIALWRYA